MGAPLQSEWYAAYNRRTEALERIAVAVEGIARAFEPAQDSLDQGPAKPDVSGVVVADD
jgi:uncharacterized protein YukE